LFITAKHKHPALPSGQRLLTTLHFKTTTSLKKTSSLTAAFLFGPRKAKSSARGRTKRLSAHRKETQKKSAGLSGVRMRYRPANAGETETGGAYQAPRPRRLTSTPPAIHAHSLLLYFSVRSGCGVSMSACTRRCFQLQKF
jgi:hypothetical protein